MPSVPPTITSLHSQFIGLGKVPLAIENRSFLQLLCRTDLISQGYRTRKRGAINMAGTPPTPSTASDRHQNRRRSGVQARAPREASDRRTRMAGSDFFSLRVSDPPVETAVRPADVNNSQVPNDRLSLSKRAVRTRPLHASSLHSCAALDPQHIEVRSLPRIDCRYLSRCAPGRRRKPAHHVPMSGPRRRITTVITAAPISQTRCGRPRVRQS